MSLFDPGAERLDEINERLEKSSLKAVFFSSLVNPSTRVLNNLIYAAVALTGAFAAVSGAMTVGVVVHSDSFSGGHGPGVTNLMCCIDGTIVPVLDENANLKTLFIDEK